MERVFYNVFTEGHLVFNSFEVHRNETISSTWIIWQSDSLQNDVQIITLAQPALSFHLLQSADVNFQEDKRFMRCIFFLQENVRLIVVDDVQLLKQRLFLTVACISGRTSCKIQPCSLHPICNREQCTLYCGTSLPRTYLKLSKHSSAVSPLLTFTWPVSFVHFLYRNCVCH